MLTQLTIKNYALIEELETSFESGFSTITGETGAGKSILLDALSLVLGKRADSSALREKDKKFHRVECSRKKSGFLAIIDAAVLKQKENVSCS